MKELVVRKCIDLCCAKALKYEKRIDMLKEQDGIRFIYAIGSNVCKRDKWLNMVITLQKIINNC